MIDKRIIGTWRLKHTKAADETGKALPAPYGTSPNGVAVFQEDGRMYALLCDGRAEMPAGEARPFMAYTGHYTFDGTTLSTRAEASSEKDRVGTDQVRTVRFEHGGMTLVPPRRLFGGVMQDQELFWERIG